eukprot:g8443.t1
MLGRREASGRLDIREMETEGTASSSREEKLLRYEPSKDASEEGGVGFRPSGVASSLSNEKGNFVDRYRQSKSRSDDVDGRSFSSDDDERSPEEHDFKSAARPTPRNALSNFVESRAPGKQPRQDRVPGRKNPFRFMDVDEGYGEEDVGGDDNDNDIDWRNQKTTTRNGNYCAAVRGGEDSERFNRRDKDHRAPREPVDLRVAGAEDDERASADHASPVSRQSEIISEGSHSHSDSEGDSHSDSNPYELSEESSEIDRPGEGEIRATAAAFAEMVDEARPDAPSKSQPQQLPPKAAPQRGLLPPLDRCRSAEVCAAAGSGGGLETANRVGGPIRPPPPKRAHTTLRDAGESNAMQGSEGIINRPSTNATRRSDAAGSEDEAEAASPAAEKEPEHINLGKLKYAELQEGSSFLAEDEDEAVCELQALLEETPVEVFYGKIPGFVAKLWRIAAKTKRERDERNERRRYRLRREVAELRWEVEEEVWLHVQYMVLKAALLDLSDESSGRTRSDEAQELNVVARGLCDFATNAFAGRFFESKSAVEVPVAGETGTDDVEKAGSDSTSKTNRKKSSALDEQAATLTENAGRLKAKAKREKTAGSCAEGGGGAAASSTAAQVRGADGNAEEVLKKRDPALSLTAEQNKLIRGFVRDKKRAFLLEHLEEIVFAQVDAQQKAEIARAQSLLHGKNSSDSDHRSPRAETSDAEKEHEKLLEKLQNEQGRRELIKIVMRTPLRLVLQPDSLELLPVVAAKLRKKGSRTAPPLDHPLDRDVDQNLLQTLIQNNAKRAPLSPQHTNNQRSSSSNLQPPTPIDTTKLLNKLLIELNFSNQGANFSRNCDWVMLGVCGAIAALAELLLTDAFHTRYTLPVSLQLANCNLAHYDTMERPDGKWVSAPELQPLTHLPSGLFIDTCKRVFEILGRHRIQAVAVNLAGNKLSDAAMIPVTRYVRAAVFPPLLLDLSNNDGSLATVHAIAAIVSAHPRYPMPWRKEDSLASILNLREEEGVSSGALAGAGAGRKINMGDGLPRKKDGMRREKVQEWLRAQEVATKNGEGAAKNVVESAEKEGPPAPKAGPLGSLAVPSRKKRNNVVGPTSAKGDGAEPATKRAKVAFGGPRGAGAAAAETNARRASEARLAVNLQGRAPLAEDDEDAEMFVNDYVHQATSSFPFGRRRSQQNKNRFAAKTARENSRKVHDYFHSLLPKITWLSLDLRFANNSQIHRVPLHLADESAVRVPPSAVYGVPLDDLVLRKPLRARVEREVEREIVVSGEGGSGEEEDGISSTATGSTTEVEELVDAAVEEMRSGACRAAHLSATQLDLAAKKEKLQNLHQNAGYQLAAFAATLGIGVRGGVVLKDLVGADVEKDSEGAGAPSPAPQPPQHLTNGLRSKPNFSLVLDSVFPQDSEEAKTFSFLLERQICDMWEGNYLLGFVRGPDDLGTVFRRRMLGVPEWEATLEKCLRVIKFVEKVANGEECCFGEGAMEMHVEDGNDSVEADNLDGNEVELDRSRRSVSTASAARSPASLRRRAAMKKIDERLDRYILPRLAEIFPPEEGEKTAEEPTSLHNSRTNRPDTTPADAIKHTWWSRDQMKLHLSSTVVAPLAKSAPCVPQQEDDERALSAVPRFATIDSILCHEEYPDEDDEDMLLGTFGRASTTTVSAADPLRNVLPNNAGRLPWCLDFESKLLTCGFPQFSRFPIRLRPQSNDPMKAILSLSPGSLATQNLEILRRFFRQCDAERKLTKKLPLATPARLYGPLPESSMSQQAPQHWSQMAFTFHWGVAKVLQSVFPQPVQEVFWLFVYRYLLKDFESWMEQLVIVPEKDWLWEDDLFLSSAAAEEEGGVEGVVEADVNSHADAALETCFDRRWGGECWDRAALEWAVQEEERWGCWGRSGREAGREGEEESGDDAESLPNHPKIKRRGGQQRQPNCTDPQGTCGGILLHRPTPARASTNPHRHGLASKAWQGSYKSFLRDLARTRGKKRGGATRWQGGRNGVSQRGINTMEADAMEAFATTTCKFDPALHLSKKERERCRRRQEDQHFQKQLDETATERAYEGHFFADAEHGLRRSTTADEYVRLAYDDLVPAIQVEREKFLLEKRIQSCEAKIAQLRHVEIAELRAKQEEIERALAEEVKSFGDGEESLAILQARVAEVQDVVLPNEVLRKLRRAEESIAVLRRLEIPRLRHKRRQLERAVASAAPSDYLRAHYGNYEFAWRFILREQDLRNPEHGWKHIGGRNKLFLNALCSVGVDLDLVAWLQELVYQVGLDFVSMGGDSVTVVSNHNVGNFLRAHAEFFGGEGHPAAFTFFYARGEQEQAGTDETKSGKGAAPAARKKTGASLAGKLSSPTVVRQVQSVQTLFDLLLSVYGLPKATVRKFRALLTFDPATAALVSYLLYVCRLTEEKIAEELDEFVAAFNRRRVEFERGKKDLPKWAFADDMCGKNKAGRPPYTRKQDRAEALAVKLKLKKKSLFAVDSKDEITRMGLLYLAEYHCERGEKKRCEGAVGSEEVPEPEPRATPSMDTLLEKEVFLRILFALDYLGCEVLPQEIFTCSEISRSVFSPRAVFEKQFEEIAFANVRHQAWNVRRGLQSKGGPLVPQPAFRSCSVGWGSKLLSAFGVRGEGLSASLGLDDYTESDALSSLAGEADPRFVFQCLRAERQKDFLNELQRALRALLASPELWDGTDTGRPSEAGVRFFGLSPDSFYSGSAVDTVCSAPRSADVGSVVPPDEESLEVQHSREQHYGGHCCGKFEDLRVLFGLRPREDFPKTMSHPNNHTRARQIFEAISLFKLFLLERIDWLLVPDEEKLKLKEIVVHADDEEDSLHFPRGPILSAVQNKAQAETSLLLERVFFWCRACAQVLEYSHAPSDRQPPRSFRRPYQLPSDLNAENRRLLGDRDRSGAEDGSDSRARFAFFADKPEDVCGYNHFVRGDCVLAGTELQLSNACPSIGSTASTTEKKNREKAIIEECCVGEVLSVRSELEYLVAVGNSLLFLVNEDELLAPTPTASASSLVVGDFAYLKEEVCEASSGWVLPENLTDFHLAELGQAKTTLSAEQLELKSAWEAKVQELLLSSREQAREDERSEFSDSPVGGVEVGDEAPQEILERSSFFCEGEHQMEDRDRRGTSSRRPRRKRGRTEDSRDADEDGSSEDDDHFYGRAISEKSFSSDSEHSSKERRSPGVRRDSRAGMRLRGYVGGGGGSRGVATAAGSGSRKGHEKVIPFLRKQDPPPVVRGRDEQPGSASVAERKKEVLKRRYSEFLQQQKAAAARPGLSRLGANDENDKENEASEDSRAGRPQQREDDLPPLLRPLTDDDAESSCSSIIDRPSAAEIGDQPAGNEAVEKMNLSPLALPQLQQLYEQNKEKNPEYAEEIGKAIKETENDWGEFVCESDFNFEQNFKTPEDEPPRPRQQGVEDVEDVVAHREVDSSRRVVDSRRRESRRGGELLHEQFECGLDGAGRGGDRRRGQNENDAAAPADDDGRARLGSTNIIDDEMENLNENLNLSGHRAKASPPRREYYKEYQHRHVPGSEELKLCIFRRLPTLVAIPDRRADFENSALKTENATKSFFREKEDFNEINRLSASGVLHRVRQFPLGHVALPHSDMLVASKCTPAEQAGFRVRILKKRVRPVTVRKRGAGAGGDGGLILGEEDTSLRHQGEVVSERMAGCVHKSVRDVESSTERVLLVKFNLVSQKEVACSRPPPDRSEDARCAAAPFSHLLPHTGHLLTAADRFGLKEEGVELLRIQGPELAAGGSRAFAGQMGNDGGGRGGNKRRTTANGLGREKGLALVEEISVEKIVAEDAGGGGSSSGSAYSWLQEDLEKLLTRPPPRPADDDESTCDPPSDRLIAFPYETHLPFPIRRPLFETFQKSGLVDFGCGLVDAPAFLKQLRRCIVSSNDLLDEFAEAHRSSEWGFFCCQPALRTAASGEKCSFAPRFDSKDYPDSGWLEVDFDEHFLNPAASEEDCRRSSSGGSPPDAPDRREHAVAKLDRVLQDILHFVRKRQAKIWRLCWERYTALRLTGANRRFAANLREIYAEVQRKALAASCQNFRERARRQAACLRENLFLSSRGDAAGVVKDVHVHAHADEEEGFEIWKRSGAPNAYRNAPFSERWDEVDISCSERGGEEEIEMEDDEQEEVGAPPLPFRLVTAVPLPEGVEYRKRLADFVTYRTHTWLRDETAQEERERKAILRRGFEYKKAKLASWEELVLEMELLGPDNDEEIGDRLHDEIRPFLEVATSECNRARAREKIPKTDWFSIIRNSYDVVVEEEVRRMEDRLEASESRSTVSDGAISRSVADPCVPCVGRKFVHEFELLHASCSSSDTFRHRQQVRTLAARTQGFYTAGTFVSDEWLCGKLSPPPDHDDPRLVYVDYDGCPVVELRESDIAHMYREKPCLLYEDSDMAYGGTRW